MDECFLKSKYNMIEIFVDGRTYGKLGSGFSVILRSMSNLWKRSFAYGKMSANQAEVEAVKFGLLSVADFYKNNEEVVLFVKNKYVSDMLEKDSDGCYTKIAKANKEQIDSMRKIFDMFKKIKVMKNDGKLSDECSMLVEKAVKNNEEIDERK